MHRDAWILFQNLVHLPNFGESPNGVNHHPIFLIGNVKEYFLKVLPNTMFCDSMRNVRHLLERLYSSQLTVFTSNFSRLHFFHICVQSPKLACIWGTVPERANHPSWQNSHNSPQVIYLSGLVLMRLQSQVMFLMMFWRSIVKDTVTFRVLFMWPLYAMHSCGHQVSALALSVQEAAIQTMCGEVSPPL